METPNHLLIAKADLINRLTEIANQESKEQRIQTIAELMRDFELTLTDIGAVAQEFVDRGYHAKQ